MTDQSFLEMCPRPEQSKSDGYDQEFYWVLEMTDQSFLEMCPRPEQSKSDGYDQEF